MHAIVKDGVVIEDNIQNIREYFPNSFLPADLTNDETLPQWEEGVEGPLSEGERVVYINTSAPPTPKANMKVVPSAPVCVNGKWQMGWKIVPMTEQEKEDVKQLAFAQVKASRQVEVDAIQVVTAVGNVFDGNETAQTRMSRAITAMDDSDTIPWVLADNSVIVVTKEELREALRLAGKRMAEVWVKPYQ